MLQAIDVEVVEISMNMGIDHAGHQCSSATVNDVCVGRWLGRDTCDAITFDGDIDVLELTFPAIEDPGVGENRHMVVLSLRLSCAFSASVWH